MSPEIFLKDEIWALIFLSFLRQFCLIHTPQNKTNFDAEMLAHGGRIHTKWKGN